MMKIASNRGFLIQISSQDSGNNSLDALDKGKAETEGLLGNIAALFGFIVTQVGLLGGTVQQAGSKTQIHLVSPGYTQNTHS